MKNKNNQIDIITFGEILWDIIDGHPHLGGAPFNLAAHASLCGLNSAVISRVGSDRLGEEALRQADRLNINRHWVMLDGSHPTGTVTVELIHALPSYTIHEQVAWDYIALNNEAVAEIAAAKPQAFCFGSLAQRCETSRNTLKQILDALDNTLVFFDVNIRQHYWSAELIREGLTRSTWLKVNDDEALLLNKELFNRSEGVADFAENVLNQYPVSGVLVTCGPAGCLVFQRDQDVISSPVVDVEVVDTVGAGDAFSAAFLAALLQGRSAEQAAECGNYRGSIVASQPGAIPELN